MMMKRSILIWAAAVCLSSGLPALAADDYSELTGYMDAGGTWPVLEAENVFLPYEEILSDGEVTGPAAADMESLELLGQPEDPEYEEASLILDPAPGEAEVPDIFEEAAPAAEAGNVRYEINTSSWTWVCYVNGKPVVNSKVGGLRWINGKTWYLFTSGKVARNIIVPAKGKYYSFDGKGNCIDAFPEGKEGWIRRWDGYYWMQKNGALLKEGGVKRLGGKYYFLHPVSGRRASGFSCLNGKYYYSWPGSGCLATGWFTVDGKTYYSLRNSSSQSFGSLVKGFAELGKKKYFFNSNGSLRKGWLDYQGKKYYFDPADGAMVQNQLLTYEGRTYYLQGNGSLYMKRGAVKIGSVYYMSDSAGRIRSCSKAENLAIQALNEVGWNVRSAYNWSTRKLRYVNISETPPAGYPNEADAWAVYGFQNKSGHCYVFACTFYQMAKVLGYEVHFLKGYVPSSRGGLATHGWCEITMDGEVYVMDCSFGHSIGNGYKIKYGQPGTWKYQGYHVVI